jgi:serine protease Do
MRFRMLIVIALLPLAFSVSRAEQNDWPRTLGISSEDSGGNSYLGIDIADITPDRLGVLKLKEERGAEVTMVDQDAPAGRAGIKEHDVILSVNGNPVEGKAQLQRMIHETPPGRVITLGLSRDGQPLTIKVQLADRKSEIHSWPSKDIHVEIPPIPPIPNMPDFDMPSMGVVYVHSSMRSGLMVENLTPQLGEFFGAKSGNGVLVRSVDKGSRGEKAGLRAGDVIVRVGDQFIRDTSDFTHALRSRNGAVNIVVIRDKREQTLTLTLPEHKDSGDMYEEESLSMPEDTAENQLELSELREELAKLQPQLELAKQYEENATPELRAAMCAQKKAMKQAADQLRAQFGAKARENWEKERQKLQRDMKKLWRQFGNEFDI